VNIRIHPQPDLVKGGLFGIIKIFSLGRKVPKLSQKGSITPVTGK